MGNADSEVIIQYQIILEYHHGPRRICVDLGCGHGVVARYLSHSFSDVIGTDPSNGMIEQAQLSISQGDHSNVTFRKSSAESLIFLKNESVDLVVAGQAAHWFDTRLLFSEMGRILRRGGKLLLRSWFSLKVLGLVVRSKLNSRRNDLTSDSQSFSGILGIHRSCLRGLPEGDQNPP